MASVESEYIVFESKIEAGRPGEVDICTRIDGMDISDEELLKIKKVQKQAAEEVEKILNKKSAPGSNRGGNEAEKKKVLTYKDGRPNFEEKEVKDYEESDI